MAETDTTEATDKIPCGMNIVATLREVETHLRYIGQDTHANIVNNVRIFLELLHLSTCEDIITELADRIHKRQNID